MDDLLKETKTIAKKPSLYRVVLLNDDFTPMDFVIALIKAVFNKSTQEAVEITMDVHKKGHGDCGVFPLDVAESKVDDVIRTAQHYEHPLQAKVQDA